MPHLKILTFVAGLTCAASGVARAQARLADLGFMTGCWSGSVGADGALVIEEHYTSPSANVMLGTTRYLQDGRAIQFEFSLLQADSASISLLPYPRGVPSNDAFELTSVEKAANGVVTAMFEAPQHDFPKRVAYRGNGEFLEATIDGGAGTDGQSWRMTQARCSTP